jgi:hypothetical protein
MPATGNHHWTFPRHHRRLLCTALRGCEGEVPYYTGEDLPRKGRVTDEMRVEAWFRWLARADLTIGGLPTLMFPSPHPKERQAEDNGGSGPLRFLPTGNSDVSVISE